MPARTLSSDAPLLSPLRYAPYVQSPILDLPGAPGHTIQSTHVAHAHVAYRPYPPSLQHFHHTAPVAPQDYVYPVAPPMQRTGEVLWHVQPVVPSQWSSSPAPGWLPHPPRVVPMPPPPPPLHKVWIVDCKACGMFLTNRGMKAVLLLHPSVPLYSTDAIPINCSPYTMTAEATAAAQTRASSSTSRDQRPPTVARTCECLTQTLWCQGCGTAVGYMIVTPCLRCTSSIIPNNRSTNGHRFVFYSAEIVASERYYIPGECGVRADAQSPSTVPYYPAPATSSPQRLRHPVTPQAQRSLRSSGNGQPWSPHRRNRSSSSSSYELQSPHSDTSSSPPPLEPVSPVHAMHRSLPPEPDPLQEGDVLFWHHLVRSGEIPAVSDDPRARAPAEDASSPTSESSSRAKADTMPTSNARAKMTAGR